MKKAVISILFIIFFGSLHAAEIRVAVASNFATTMQQIVAEFEQQTGHKVKLSIGSTGKHYAQILNGAPFDLFFSADSKRPQLLEESSNSMTNSRFTYAVGKLLLWSPKQHFIDSNELVLKQGNYRFLAIANPKLAPYGRAAKEVLIKLGLWKGLRRKMVRGENIGHTFQFVKSENAQLGFIAASQVTRPHSSIKGSFWRVPESYYSPIKQQAVRLNDLQITKDFANFVQSARVKMLIRQFGYETI